MEKLRLLILDSKSLSEREKSALIKILPQLDEQAKNELIQTFEREHKNLSAVDLLNNAAGNLIENMALTSVNAYKKSEKIGIEN
jgi:hypothetical protein